MRGSGVIRGECMTDSELLANSIEALVQRVAGTSVQEIDGLIAELRGAHCSKRRQPAFSATLPNMRI